MSNWREQAQASGMSPTAIQAKPAELNQNFPKLAQEIKLGPDTGFAQGGYINPDYMRAEMMVQGLTPQKYAAGSSVTNELDPQESRRNDMGMMRRMLPEAKKRAMQAGKFGVNTALPGYFGYEALSALPENIGTGDYGTGIANAIIGGSSAAQMMPRTAAQMIGPSAASGLSKAWMPLMAAQMLGHHGDLNEGENEQLKLQQGFVDARKDPFFEGSVFSAQKR